MMRYAWLCGFVLSAVACGGSSDNDDDTGGSGGTSSAGSNAGGGTTSAGGTSATGGTTSTGGTSSSAEGVPLQNLPLELGTATCGKVFECCSDEEIAANPFFGEDESSCTIAIAAFASFLVPAIQDAEAGGRAEYDGAAFESCLAVLEGLSCAEARSGSADVTSGQDCAEFLVPLVELGGECEQSFECIDGWCDMDAGSLCSPLKADGAECADDEECQSGYCDPLDGCGAEPTDTGDNLCGG